MQLTRYGLTTDNFILLSLMTAIADTYKAVTSRILPRKFNTKFDIVFSQHFRVRQRKRVCATDATV